MVHQVVPAKSYSPSAPAVDEASPLSIPASYTRRFVHNSVMVLLFDCLALSLALLIGGMLRYWFRGDSMVPGWSWLILPVWAIGAGFMHLVPGWGIGSVEQLRRLVTLIFASFAFAGLALFLSKTSAEVSRFTLTTSVIIALFLLPLVRTRLKSALISRRCWGLPTVVYGSDDTAAHVLQALRHEQGLGYMPVGIFDNESVPGTIISGVPVLGRLDERTDMAHVAVIATAQTSRQRLIELLEGNLSGYRRIVIIPDLLDAPSLWVTTRDFVGLVGLEIAVNLLNPVARFAKRAVDILIAVGLAPLWIPLGLIIALLIWLDDRHSPLFLQERIGFKGRRFRTWKFRTMHPDAEEVLKREFSLHPELEEEWTGEFKLRNDPRITRIGAALRKLSLDELPQLVNVLRGEMSLVGPRPLPEYHYEQLTAQIRSLRDRVRPGITGLWQVSGRSDSGTSGMERWDAYYVRNWSIWLDIVILVRTLRAVISGRGAY